LQRQSMEKFLEQLGISQNLLIILVAAVVAAIALYMIVRRLGRRRPPVAPPVDLLIDVASLGSQGPPPGPQLEIYNVPVRLAALVFAPAGRADELPITATRPEFA